VRRHDHEVFTYRGVSWTQIANEVIAAPAAAGGTYREWSISPLQDFKLVWTNGGTAQNPWVVDIATRSA